ncbi:ATP-binding protein [Streptomyces sp. SLBN-118]|uniref:ATP-binding protein n=1 Tax=Streptomyces sp. SLBN-118 TaxID=2768454 RepID=UPI0028C3F09E|nr:ATP-binding protein [Streptomyces sp. SLBN-118]
MSSNNTKQAGSNRDVTSELIYLTKALKAPALRDAAARLADRARSEEWSHEEYLAACLQREVAARDSHGAEGRVRAARFPSRKSLEDFDFDHQRSVKREVIAHLGTLDFVVGKENVIFLGPPGTGKTHLATGLGIRACQAGHRVAFATAAQWVTRLAASAHPRGEACRREEAVEPPAYRRDLRLDPLHDRDERRRSAGDQSRKDCRQTGL